MKTDKNIKGLRDKSIIKPYQRSLTGKLYDEKEAELPQDNLTDAPNVTSIETAEKVDNREENY